MIAALTLFCLAISLLLYALRLRRQTGVPWTRVVASDTHDWRTLERPLFSRRYGLTGKPDYLLDLARAYVPIEIKPTRRAVHPYESDLMQLVAYCLLVEETTGRPPPYGLLRYADTTFRVDYTPAVRAELLAILETMRADLEAADCPRSHDEPRRCAGCGFFDMCEDALVDETG
jgi:CRISPR-associated exonuclease Cas4